MDQKTVTIAINKGMQRDLSISKEQGGVVYENMNVRITSTDKDTMLSVTNEKGTKQLSTNQLNGTVLGYGVLDNYIIVFTKDASYDYIYRITCGDEVEILTIFEGNLNFSKDNPIETITSKENEDILKIYWVDGRNVLRSLIFSDTYLQKHTLEDNTYDFSPTSFDSTKGVTSLVNATIEKDNNGNSRPCGVVQYFLSLYNKNHSSTGVIWSSPLVYTSKENSGGSPEDTCTTRVTLKFTNIDVKFDYARLYKVESTSLSTTPSAYVLEDRKIEDSTLTIIDDNSKCTLVDPTEILFLGGKSIIPSTMSHKDNTLFLGDITTVKHNLNTINYYIKQFFIQEDGESELVTFEHKSISYDNDNINSLYPYTNRLKYSSDKLLSFKGNERYRFAIKLYKDNGESSDAIWIGDKTNGLYPMPDGDLKIKIPIAKIDIPNDLKSKLLGSGYSRLQLLIAERNLSNSSVLAQGILCPTVFNLHDRYNKRVYSQASWSYRPVNGKIAYKHLEGLHTQDGTGAELQCVMEKSSPLYYEYDATAGPDVYLFDNLYIPLSTSVNLILTKISQNGYKLEVTYNGDSAFGSHTDTYAFNANSTISDLKAKINFILSSIGIPERFNTFIEGDLNRVSSSISETAYTSSECKVPKGNFFKTFAEYNKNKFYVDWSIVTLNSPDVSNIPQEASNLKLRVVGVAPIAGNISDYNINVKDRYGYPGTAVDNFLNFSVVPKSDSKFSPLYTFPLIKEWYTNRENKTVKEAATYMTYMWHKSNAVSGIKDDDGNMLSVIDTKRFTNLLFSKYTIPIENKKSYSCSCIKRIDELGSSLYELDKNENVIYAPEINSIITQPETNQYSIQWAFDVIDTSESFALVGTKQTNDPIPITYRSKDHAIIRFGTQQDGAEILLPSFDDVKFNYNANFDKAVWSTVEGKRYSFSQYLLGQFETGLDAQPSQGDSQYLFIGELYKEFDNPIDQYGSSNSNNVFIPCSEIYELNTTTSTIINCYGDTFYQRWDSIKTVPYSDTDINQVIDGASVMLESWQNLDGRYDKDRGTNKMSLIDIDNFGRINPVYSMKDNFIQILPYNEDNNHNAFPSTITWTLPKASNADIDEWLHITLASSLDLDSDKGKLNALHTFGNEIYAFQDKGISRILFNSRTALTTAEGVPVEIANSGKVEGKIYIPGKFGLTNKWSLVEGKLYLYFVDNINKAFCAFDGKEVTDISTKLGFNNWFSSINTIAAWKPENSDSIISFYDKGNSDVYLVGGSVEDKPCLVYNEILGTFTSFFSYNKMPMLTNINDRLISIHDGYLWEHNKGEYGSIFGENVNSYILARVHPTSYETVGTRAVQVPDKDKIWSSIEYRGDVYENDNLTNSDFIEGLYTPTGDVKPLFSSIDIWHEHQRTHIDGSKQIARFRVWRSQIEREITDGTPSRNRIRNSWVLAKFNFENYNKLVQLHDIVMKYYE